MPMPIAYSNWISLPSFKLTVNRYRERVLNSNLVLPEYVIYIDISSQTSIDRQLNNIRANKTVGLPYFWQNKYFLDDIILSYEKLWECLLNIPVYKTDGKLSVKEKLLQLKEWLKTKNSLKGKTKYKKN